MTATIKDFWDTRYKMDDFAYGEAPNKYLEEKIKEFNPGKVLFPAEGEGRNAVFAAQLGWEVNAFDISAEGKSKALSLADKHNVKIDYQVGELSELGYKDEEFDALVLIFAHFPPNIKADLQKNLCKLLRKGGIVIFEAFSKNNLQYLAKNPNVGGPNNVEMLFSEVEIKSHFPDFEIIELSETETYLSEGFFHNGLASVIRFIGRKK